MASVKDAVEESITDNHAIFKIILYSVPLFLCTQLIIAGAKFPSGLLLIGSVLTSILLFGYMLRCTINVASGSNSVLPSFNVFKVFLTGLKGAVVLAPIAIISKILATLCIGFLANAPLPGNLIIIFSWIIGIIFGSFVYTSYLLYSRRCVVIDAYNISAISRYCIDILLGVIFMKVLLLLVDIILIVPVGYVLWLFFGLTSAFSVFFLCVVAVFNISVMGHYLAQIGYEVIETEEEEKAEDAKYKEEEKDNKSDTKNN